jgi:hypothetical protein
VAELVDARDLKFRAHTETVRFFGKRGPVVSPKVMQKCAVWKHPEGHSLRLNAQRGLSALGAEHEAEHGALGLWADSYIEPRVTLCGRPRDCSDDANAHR